MVKTQAEQKLYIGHQNPGDHYFPNYIMVFAGVFEYSPYLQVTGSDTNEARSPVLATWTPDTCPLGPWSRVLARQDLTW